MSYGDLPTSELAPLAQQEAEKLHAPPDLFAGRELIHGDAVQDDPTCVNKAVGMDVNTDGQKVLRVSVPDIAPFLSKAPALAAYALRMGYPMLDKSGATVPMLPHVLSSNKFSLLHGRMRPVVSFRMPLNELGETNGLFITRDVIKTRVLTPAKAEDTWVREEDNGPLARLESIATELHESRLHDYESDTAHPLETEEGKEQYHDYPVGLFIMQEATFALNAAVGAYIKLHNIPAVLSNHVLLGEDEFLTLEELDSASMAAELRYSAIPQGHVAMGLSPEQPYAHADMPLTYYDSLLNVLNLTANSENGDYPFDALSVSHAVKRMNFLMRKAEGRLASGRPKEPSPPKRKPPKKQPSIDELSQSLEDDTIHAGDLSYALFKDLLRGEEVPSELKQRAIHYLTEHPEYSRQILQTAAERKWIVLATRPVESEDKPQDVAINVDGEEFKYDLSHNPRVNGARAAELIGKLIGHKIRVKLPTKEEYIEQNPYSYLRGLSGKHLLHIRWGELETSEPTDETTVNVSIMLHGIQHSRPGSGPDVSVAQNVAARALIADLGLAEGVPPAPEVAEAERDPITQLNNHSARRGVSPPKYTFPEAKEGDDAVCIVEYIDADGNPQAIPATASDPKIAKAKAAELALGQLPPPLPRKNKKKKKK